LRKKILLSLSPIFQKSLTERWRNQIIFFKKAIFSKKLKLHFLTCHILRKENEGKKKFADEFFPFIKVDPANIFF